MLLSLVLVWFEVKIAKIRNLRMEDSAADQLAGLRGLLEEFRSYRPSSQLAQIPFASAGAFLNPQGSTTSEGSFTAAQEALPESYQTAQEAVPRGGLLELPFLLSQEPSLDSGSHGEVQLPFEHLQSSEHSLPCLATELVAAQASQADEVQRRKDTLSQLQSQLSREKDQLSSIEREICSTAKTICLSQDECASLGEDCANLKKEISQLVTDKYEVELKLRRIETEAERGEKMFKVYRDKMEKHMARTREVERTMPLYVEVEGLKRSIQALKEQRCEYMQGEGLQILNGEKHAALQEEIDGVLATLAGVQEETEEKRKMVESCKERKQQIQREMDMKRKRHGAQLTRLQRQVSEAQSRKRQWAKEAERLQINITQLKQKLRG